MKRCPLNLKCDCYECNFSSPEYFQDGSISDECNQSKVMNYLSDKYNDYQEELVNTTDQQRRNEIKKYMKHLEQLYSDTELFFEKQ